MHCQLTRSNRYGCADIAKHDLQRLNYKVTENLFAWKENLPSNLQVDLDNDNVPVLPHLLMLQYVMGSPHRHLQPPV